MNKLEFPGGADTDGKLLLKSIDLSINNRQVNRYFTDVQNEVQTNSLRHFYNQLFKFCNAYYQNSQLDISFDEFKGKKCKLPV